MKYLLTYPLRILWAIMWFLISLTLVLIGAILDFIWNLKIRKLSSYTDYLIYDTNEDYAHHWGTYDPQKEYITVLHWAFKIKPPKSL